MSEEQVKRLEDASDYLEKYSHDASCAWCKMKAMQIKTAIDELKEAMPLAEQLSTKIDNLRSNNMNQVLTELKEFKSNAADVLHTHDEVSISNSDSENISETIKSGGILSRDFSPKTDVKGIFSGSSLFSGRFRGGGERKPLLSRFKRGNGQ